ncbi:MAG TPA: AEC family transporter [Ignavibacteriales bacterium]|nr:AEC family transporter [Ignavibacteriales bacterium]
MENLVFIFNTIAPVFLIILAGFVFRRLNMLDDNFIDLSSKLVFKVSLPALIFAELSQTNFKEEFSASEIIFIYAGTLISFAASWALASLLTKDPKDKGPFIQGAFRGNYVIVGLAIIENLLGDGGLAQASLYLAFLLPAYNILAVLALALPMRKERAVSLSGLFLEILKNPLIIAVVLSILFAAINLKFPEPIMRAFDYLGSLSLPLALIGIGGSLKISEAVKASRMSVYASLLKIAAAPLVITTIGLYLGYTGETLVIMFIIFGCPTAVASYVMAGAMGCNSRLAGDIIALTTMGSIITLSAGLYILKSLGIF